MEGEFGVVEFPFRGRIAASLKPKERLMSISLTEIVTQLALDTSYRGAAELANKIYHRTYSDSFIAETIKARCIRIGTAILSDYTAEATKVLEKHHIDQSTGIIDDASEIPYAVRNPDLPDAVSSALAKDVVETCNEGRTDRERITDMETVGQTEACADDCVYISVDDVGVKHQKDERKPGAEKQRKYVQNTVIHIQSGERQQTLTAIGMDTAFRLLVAFLLTNRLLEDKRLVFLTDGATGIKECVAKFFGFREYTLILDWLHLKKKCKEYLSMAVKGCGKTKDKRREDKARIIRGLLRILWAGNAQDAIGYLEALEAKNISNQYQLELLKGYIGRKEENIACYAFRQKMGLRVSSNRVEKTNDLLVAKRQKHNGMSWSEDGSGALAVITALHVNGKLDWWLKGVKRLLTMPEAA